MKNSIGADYVLKIINVDVTMSFTIFPIRSVIASVYKSNKKERGVLALLLLHVRWVVFRAKANVPKARSRYITYLSWQSLSR